MSNLTLELEVTVIEDCLPFISKVNGAITWQELKEIENELIECEDLFTHGTGIYEITADYVSGEFEDGIMINGPYNEFVVRAFFPFLGVLYLNNK